MQRNVFWLSFICFLACDVQAFPFWGSKDPVDKGKLTDHLKNVTLINEFVDVCMREIGMIVASHDMDPISGPAFEQYITVGTIAMQEIKVYNLSTIQRTQDVQVFDNKEEEKLIFDMAIGFKELQVFANYNAYNWLMSSEGKVRGKIPGINIQLKVEIDLDTFHLEMQQFSIKKNNASMELEFYDNSESYYINMFSSFVINMFGDMILGLIETPIKNIIDELVVNINVAMDKTVESFANQGVQKPETPPQVA